MEIKPLKEEQSTLGIICESYIITKHSSIEELIEIYLEYSKQNKGKSIVLTLDDLGQAEYTSAHATINHDLDNIEGYDLSDVHPSAFENGEHIGYLSTRSEFFIIKGNFNKKVQSMDFSSVCQRGLTMDNDELDILKEINTNPHKFLDEDIIVKIVPVDKSYAAICGFPNGYFSCDLNPFENFALAKYLHIKYNYELFGIGASLIGFIRNTPLSIDESKELVDDLSKLYNQPELNFERIINKKNGYNLLFLKYVESLE